MLTKEQRNTGRAYHLGGSDLNNIMKKSSFVSLTEFCYAKWGYQSKDKRFIGNVYTECGNQLEARVRTRYNEMFNSNYEDVDHIEYVKEFTHNDVPLRFVGHVDGFDKDKNEVIEIKVTTSSINQALKTYEWQMRCYMLLTDTDSCRLVVYKRDKDLLDIMTHTRDILELPPRHAILGKDMDVFNKMKKILAVNLDHYELNDLQFQTIVIKRDKTKEKEMLDKCATFWEFFDKHRDNPDIIFTDEFEELERKLYD